MGNHFLHLLFDGRRISNALDTFYYWFASNVSYLPVLVWNTHADLPVPGKESVEKVQGDQKSTALHHVTIEEGPASLQVKSNLPVAVVCH